MNMKSLLPICAATLLGTSAIAANNTKEISREENKTEQYNKIQDKTRRT